MKLNESTAVSTAKVLLVPYERRHVPKYHAWMEDPAIQEATASDRLTLEEEYENQGSWRASHDKLTFIICQPLSATDSQVSITEGEADCEEKMIGDVNFFLHDGEDEEGFCVGEVDIMIAGVQDRGKGVGRAVVSSFLHYLQRNLDGVLTEYKTSRLGDNAELPKLRQLVVKIKADNAASIALFKSLGFTQEGGVNYFGEIKLVLHDFEKVFAAAPEGYAELIYSRRS
ncbi:hypothetical protein OQA88_4687 [Cercophora sp. LCS_1]